MQVTSVFVCFIFLLGWCSAGTVIKFHLDSHHCADVASSPLFYTSIGAIETFHVIIVDTDNRVLGSYDVSCEETQLNAGNIGNGFKILSSKPITVTSVKVDGIGSGCIIPASNISGAGRCGTWGIYQGKDYVYLNSNQYYQFAIAGSWVLVK